MPTRDGREAPRLSFRQASAADAAAVCALVNSAYRGDSSRRGWTTEADYLDGQRIDSEMLLDMLGRPDTRVELAFLPDGALAACVELRQESPDCGYLGMLTVDPTRQGGGVGQRLLERAETLARERGCRRMRMRVIDGRDELIRYYERRGYRRTEGSEPFPSHDPRFGIPKVSNLRFIVLAKELSQDRKRPTI